MKGHHDVYIPERLSSLLDRILKKRITLISAPAGYGKSELVKYWCRIAPQPFLWIECVDFVQRPKTLLERLEQARYEANGSRFIVLEDVQALTESPPMMDTLIQWIRSHITTLRLILLSRQRVRQLKNHSELLHHLWVLTADELKFTEVEISLWADIHGFSLSDFPEIQLTDGCPALLQIARKCEESHTPLVDEKGRVAPALEEYVLTQWLQALPTAPCQKLYHLCLPPYFSLDLAQEFLGEDSEHVIEQLEDHLLLTKTFSHKRWLYHFHPLLRLVIMERFAAKDVANHERIIRFLEQEGLLPEAVELSLHSGVVEKALNYLKQVAPDMLKRQEYEQLKNWLDRLASQMIEQDAEIKSLFHHISNLLALDEKHLSIHTLLTDTSQDRWSRFISVNRSSIPFSRHSRLLDQALPQVAERMQQLIENVDSQHTHLPYYHLIKAEVFYEQNMMEGAERELERLWQCPGSNIHPGLSIPALWLQLRCKQAEQKQKEVRFIAQEIYYRSLDTTIHVWRRVGAAIKMYVAYLDGYTQEAEEWLIEQKHLLNRYWNEWNSFEYFMMVRMLIAFQWYDEAVYLLQRMVMSKSVEHNPVVRLERRLLQTISAIKLERMSEASSSLLDALETGKQYGLIRPFLDQDPLLFLAFPTVQERLPDHLQEYYQKLLHQIHSEEVKSVKRSPVLKDALTMREIEILRYIEKGLSNREIGEKLKITEGTVKGHLNRIYKKLQVKNRVHAVKVAEEQNIL